MPDQKIVSEILNKIFRNPEIQYGLKEFEQIKPEEMPDDFLRNS